MNAPFAVGSSSAIATRSPGRGPDLSWWLAAAALAATLAIPFLMVDVPPVQDYPNHLARYFVLAHPDDPLLSQIYAPHWQILPNLAMDVLGAALLKLTPIHVGGRLLLALSLFAPMVGAIVYSRVAFGRFLYWPLASGVMAYNGIFFLGFMNFLLALGVALVGAACWMALRRASRPALAALAGAFAASVIFFCHIFGVILFAVLLGSFELARLIALYRTGALRFRSFVDVALLALVVLAPLVLLYLACPLSQSAQTLGEWGGIHKLAAFLTPFATYNKFLTLLTTIVVLVFFVLNWRSLRVAPGIPLALMALLMIYAAMPIAINKGSFIDARFGVMMALLLFAGTAPGMERRPAVIAATIFAALIGIRSAYISSVWLGHRQDLADVRTAIAAVPAGARVMSARGHLGYVTDVPRSSRALPGFYRLDGHLPALLLIERRAFWPLLFADQTQQPVIVRPPYDAVAHPLSESVYWPVLRRESFTSDDLQDARYLPDWRSKFDYVLLIDPPEDVMPLPRGLLPVTTTSFAILYKVAPSPPR